jgi:hypothetical protein
MSTMLEQNFNIQYFYQWPCFFIIPPEHLIRLTEEYYLLVLTRLTTNIYMYGASKGISKIRKQKFRLKMIFTDNYEATVEN